jgi:hypothetical protein
MELYSKSQMSDPFRIIGGLPKRDGVIIDAVACTKYEETSPSGNHNKK